MKKRFYGTLDRIEDNIAVIITDGDCGTVEIEKSLLPDNAKEGDVISFMLEVKDKRTKAEKEKVERLIKKLSS